MFKTVREDQHSILINHDGSTYRPVPSRWSHDPLHTIHKNYFKKGDKVNIKNNPHNSFIIVEGDMWFGHGGYLNNIGYSSGVFPYNPIQTRFRIDMKYYDIDEILSYNMHGVFGLNTGAMEFLTREGKDAVNKLILSVMNDPQYRMARDADGRLLGHAIKNRKD